MLNLLLPFYVVQNFNQWNEAAHILPLPLTRCRKASPDMTKIGPSGQYEPSYFAYFTSLAVTCHIQEAIISKHKKEGQMCRVTPALVFVRRPPLPGMSSCGLSSSVISEIFFLTSILCKFLCKCPLVKIYFLLAVLNCHYTLAVRTIGQFHIRI